MSLDRSSTRAILQDTLDALVDCAALLGPAGDIVLVNQAWASHALRVDEIGSPIGTMYVDLLGSVAGVPASEVPAASRGLRRVLAGEVDQYQLDYQCSLREDPHWVRMTVRCIPRRDDLAALIVHSDRTHEQVLSHGMDVTEQANATERFRRNEQRLRDVFAKLPVPTYLFELRDERLVLLDCNEMAVQSLPQHTAGAVGRTLREIFPGFEPLEDDARRCLRENVVVRRTIEADLGELVGRRRFDLTIGPQQPDRMLIHAVDTTERAELEAQFRQEQKMDAIGRLAGGVAHDFNNLLTVIDAHSAFLIEALSAGDPLLEDAEAIRDAGVRAATLTRQLLAFSRKQILKPTVVNLNATVMQARTLLHRLLGEDIELVTRLGDDVRPIVADPSQIDQVLMNLAVNARDAMPSGGKLTITTWMSTIGDEHDENGMVPPGEYAVLSVSDAGIGMDSAVQGKLFEPFFTTKGPGRGTGLGLATVYGIVKQSRGYISVESAPGAGAAFNVYLPAVSAASQQSHAELRGTGRVIETILVVEDEPAVLQVANRVLRREGYVVLEANDGFEALALSAAYEGDIHLVVSDVVMPGMRGAEVVQRLQAQRPHLKALLMSGYTDDEIVRRGVGASKLPFVSKPFSARDLKRAVRETLDNP